MAARDHAERLWSNLVRLGPRKLAALAIVGLSVVAVTGVAGLYLSRPASETLYSGLDREDVSRIGSALRDAGMPFDVSPEGTTVLVPYGRTAATRMFLAEKGLPHSADAGYELFDKLGSLGLTSFMQEVTRVRALEGELARTIQSMRGVKAARVHIVLPDEGSFRRTRQPPSASVVIRTENSDDAAAAQAIRHLVASAVPTMQPEQVTVLSSDGVLLASGNEQADAVPGQMLTLEKSVSNEVQDNIRRTLAPYLNLRNFQVSVATRVNTDKKQTAETIYNPDNKVERSVRTVRETRTAQNASSQNPVSVDRNVPQSQTQSSDGGKQSTEDNQKREELTNYELSSKTVTTVSNGYAIDNLSVAILINKASLMAVLGDKATPETLAKQVAEIESLATSAAGLRKERGDSIKVSAVDFVDGGRDMEPVPTASLMEQLMRQSGTLINAGTLFAVVMLVLWFGVRPITKTLLASPTPVVHEAPMLAGPSGAHEMALSGDAVPALVADAETSLLENLSGASNRSPQKRLEQLIDFDEDQAAAVLRQWMHQRDAA